MHSNTIEMHSPPSNLLHKWFVISQNIFHVASHSWLNKISNISGNINIPYFLWRSGGLVETFNSCSSMYMWWCISNSWFTQQTNYLKRNWRRILISILIVPSTMPTTIYNLLLQVSSLQLSYSSSMCIYFVGIFLQVYKII